MIKLRSILSSSLGKQLSLYTLSSYLNKAIPFILLPFFTRYLSPEDYGEVSMFCALVSLIISLSSWSSDGALMRKYYDVEKSRLSEYFFNYLLICITSILAISVIFIIFRTSISELSGVSQQWLFLAVLAAISTIICYYINSYFQVAEQPLKYALFTNGWTLTEAMLSISFIVFCGLGASGRIYGITVSYILFAIIGLIILTHELGISVKFNKEAIQEELQVFGLPSLPMNLRGTVLQFVDRFFIANIVGLSTVGLYAAGNQLAMVVEVLVRSISLALTPWMYKRLQDNTADSKIKIVKSVYCIVAGVVVFSVVWWGIAVLGAPLLLGSNYLGSTSYLGWLISSKVFMGLQLIFVNFIYFYKKTKSYAILSIVSIFLQIILNYWLVSTEGAIGAAKATTIIYSFTFIITIYIVNSIIKLPWVAVFPNKISK